LSHAEWLVTAARRATELTSNFTHSKTGNFVIVDFTFTNRSNDYVGLDLLCRRCLLL
jgi:hypothetical protein